MRIMKTIDPETAVNRLTLKQLRIFVTVAANGSFSRAAEAISLSNASVTQAIKDLEYTLGVQVFERSTRNVKLTKEGQYLNDQVTRSLYIINEACRHLLETRRHEHHALTVGTLSSLAHIVVRSIAEYKRAFPESKVILREAQLEDLYKGVDGGHFNVALAAEGNLARDYNCKFIHLVDEPLLLVLNPAHTKAPATVSRAALTDYKLVVPSTGATASVLERMAKRNGLVIDRMIEVDTVVSAIELVKQGVGVTIVPKTLLDTFPDSGLVAIGFDEPITRKLGLLLQVDEDDVNSASTRTFINAIRGEFKA